MSEHELIDQYIDALRQNPNAAPPPGLDADTAAFVRSLALSQQGEKPTDSMRDRVWHKALTLAEKQDSFGVSNVSKNGRAEQQVTFLKPGQNRDTDDDNRYPITDAAQEPTSRFTPGTRSPTIRYFWQYTLTLAAAILMIALLGSLLIQMGNDPTDGFPSASSLETTEPIPACDIQVDYMAQGEASIIAGNYDAAMVAYNCAIEVDPADYTAYLWRGGLAGSGGDYDQLGNDLFTVMRRRGGSSDPMRLAAVRMIAGLNSASRLRPDDPVPYLLRGLANLVSGISAEPDFERVMELVPENASPYLLYWAGNNQNLVPDFSDEFYVQGAERTGNSTLLSWLVSLSFSEPMAEMWQPYFDQLIESNPDHPFAYEARGMAKAVLGDATAASDFYHHIQNNQTEAIEGEPIVLGKSLALEGGTGVVYRLPLSVEAGQTVNMTEERLYAFSLVYPPTMVVLAPDGTPLSAPYTLTPDVGGSTLAIRGLEIPESGLYTLLVMSNYTGQMAIRVAKAK
jgi:tetratricopeptide (TPR) repeat protein